MYMKPKKREFARYLRRKQTSPEEIMWKVLRGRKFCGLKFRRQHVAHGFVADFYCHERNLIVEIDGWVHNRQKDYDRTRDMLLMFDGYKIIRFKNEEVVENLSGVLRKLERALTLHPSPRGRGKS
jgi:very-short-patch-repair endonuclease